MKLLRFGAVLLFLAGLCACSKGNDKTIILGTDGKHPANWVVAVTGGNHPANYLSSPGACQECHGKDLLGGISKVSCFSSDRNGISCHPQGPSGHPANFAQASLHGANAKAAVTGINGMAFCKNCHGSDYRGAGSSNKDCIGCHRLTTPSTNAPHAPAPWRGGAFTHTNVDQTNAAACAQCHTNGQNLSTPVISSYASGTPGCFNSTLCHGVVGHSGDPRQPWANPENHGAAAKGNPGAGDGLAQCKTCHGQALTGNGSAVSCFSCHATAPHSPAPWRRTITNTTGRIHTDTNTQNAPVCAGCHINNQRLTTPVAVNGTPGCFDNSMCHGATGHTDTSQFPVPAQPWKVPVNHGIKAKGSTAVGASGFTYCRTCHGDGSAQYPLFQGGIALTSCMNVIGCHITLLNNNAPHPSKPWRGTTAAGSTGHSSTDTSNDTICSICHTGGNNSTRVPQPLDIVGTTGCFNATLCHGVTGHADTTVYPAPWSSPANHGAFARSDPSAGGPKGLLYCQHCHGTDFSGGSANQSCYPCHGVSAPHPSKIDWTLKAGTLSHVNAGEGNSVICANCHNANIKNLSAPYLTRFASSPAGSFNNVALPGCYNASMCHGDVRKTSNCDACHSTATTIPFKSMAGATANTDSKVGAHVDHLNANVSAHSVSVQIACSECHNVPTIPDITATHRNNSGTAQVVFGTLAKTNAAVPAYNTATGQCTNVYCHGAKMPGGDATGTNIAPTWNVPFLPATISAAACGTCHGFPPSTASGHPTVTIPAGFPSTPLGTTCSCHANINTQTATAATYANIFVNKTRHINGALEVNAGAAHAVPNYDHQAAGAGSACTGCHVIGSAASVYPASTLGNPPDCRGCHKKAAPGIGCGSCHGDATGRPNAAAFPDLVGRHQGSGDGAHLSAACTKCHIFTGTPPASGSGAQVNHGPGNRDANPNLVGPQANFITGITITGATKGVSPSASCVHTTINANNGGGCSGGGSGTRTW